MFSGLPVNCVFGEYTLTLRNSSYALTLPYGVSWAAVGCWTGSFSERTWSLAAMTVVEGLTRLAVGGGFSEDSLEGRLRDKVNITTIDELNAI